jgi:lactate racemase
MWYWGSHALKHVGKVIIVGGDAATVRKLGFTPASTMNDALEIASDTVGRSPTITHIKTPPLMIADVK